MWDNLTTVPGYIVKLTSAADSRSNQTTVLVMVDGSRVDHLSSLPSNGAAWLAEEGNSREAAIIRGSLSCRS
jgi:hypothetical protein